MPSRKHRIQPLAVCIGDANASAIPPAQLAGYLAARGHRFADAAAMLRHVQAVPGDWPTGHAGMTCGYRYTATLAAAIAAGHI